MEEEEEEERGDEEDEEVESVVKSDVRHCWAVEFGEFREIGI